MPSPFVRSQAADGLDRGCANRREPRSGTRVPGPMPRAAPASAADPKERCRSSLFPACINRMFGRDPDGPASPSLPETFVTLSGRAGKPLWIPPDVAGLCCSTPWKSKGYPQGHEYMAKSIADALWRWSDGGKIPIVVDAASCTLGLSEDIATLLDAETKEQVREPDDHRLDRVVSRSSSEPDNLAYAAAGRRAPDLLYHALGVGWHAQADRDASG